MTGKNKIILLFLAAFAFFIIPISAFAAPPGSPVKGNNVFRTIVKIYTYAEDKNHYLSAVASGSGIIIQNNGIVLTNSHVVNHQDESGNKLPTTLKVCYNAINTEKPDCEFIAYLIADDPKKDVALLKIENINPYINTQTDYIERIVNDNINVDDHVYALGFPDFGAGKITLTEGKVLEKVIENNVEWIKTDRIFSFGSSGGALVDIYGTLLGIPTQVRAEEGFSINVGSINEWIEDNISNIPGTSELQKRMEKLIRFQDDILSYPNFSLTNPSLKFTKPISWQFLLENENYVKVYKPGSDTDGYYEATWYPANGNAKALLDSEVKEYEKADGCVAKEAIVISGQAGKKLECKIEDETVTKFVIPVDSYFVVFINHFRQDASTLLDAILRTEIVSLEKTVPANIAPVKIESPKPPMVLGAVFGEGNPGVVAADWLIKNKKFSEVFYVDKDKCLHWIINEKIAKKNFGITWNYEGNIKEFDSISGFKFCEQLD